MKNSILSIICLFTLCFTSHSQVTNYNVGDNVDNFICVTTEGDSIDLYETTASGQYVFINFFNTECPDCQAICPIYNELYSYYGCNSADLRTLNVDVSDKDNVEIQSFQDTFGGPLNICPSVNVEGSSVEIATNFGVTTCHTICVISDQNKMMNVNVNPIPNVEALEAAFPVNFNPALTTCSVLAINKKEKGITISAYPNPAYQMINFTFSFLLTEDIELNIYNMLGEKIESIDITSGLGENNILLDISKYVNGKYILQTLSNRQITTLNFDIMQ